MAKKITYKASGVDITKADQFVKAIAGAVKSTLNPSVLKNKKAFGSLYALDKKTVLVSSTDGVGTKLLVAKVAGKHDTVGIDLVAMNVNDILCVGAKPLFFLDYIACGKLNNKVLKEVVEGIATGCCQAGCALVGGETAEMPGMYAAGDYDLAGFALGVVKRNKMIDGSKIKERDIVIGLPSSGIHSNGYSLVRKVFSKAEQKKYAKDLLAPTRIYVKEVLPLLEKFPVNGMAHITGGAFYEKLTKILPPGLCFAINKGSWPASKIFQKIQKKGKINDSEMYRTFNMGIGFALVVNKRKAAAVQAFLRRRGMKSYIIGTIIKSRTNKIIFF